MATAEKQMAAVSLEDTYQLGDSDAENDDADQVSKDIEEFEARLRGEKTAPKASGSTAIRKTVRARSVKTRMPPACADVAPHPRDACLRAGWTHG